MSERSERTGEHSPFAREADEGGLASAGLHADAVRVLSDWCPSDAGQDALRREFLAHLAEHADGMWRECVAGHLTASTAVLDATGERVLLTLHPKAKMWLQLGGHCERADTSLAEAALREAAEESGIEGLRLLPGPVRVDRHRVWCHGGSYHLDVQYTAVAPCGRPPADQCGVRRPALVPAGGRPGPRRRRVAPPGRGVREALRRARELIRSLRRPGPAR